MNEGQSLGKPKSKSGGRNNSPHTQLVFPFVPYASTCDGWHSGGAMVIQVICRKPLIENRRPLSRAISGSPSVLNPSPLRAISWSLDHQKEVTVNDRHFNTKADTRLTRTRSRPVRGIVLDTYLDDWAAGAQRYGGHQVSMILYLVPDQ